MSASDFKNVDRSSERGWLLEAWGTANLRALLERERWLSREHERIELGSSHSIVRRLTIEFRVPDALRRDGLDISRAPLLIAQVPRQQSGPVQVRDQAGARLATLNTAEADALFEHMLMAAALQAMGGGLSARDADSLGVLIGRMARLAGPERERLREELSRFDGPTGRLADDRSFLRLLEQVAGQEAIVVEVDADRRERHIVTISYELGVGRSERVPMQGGWGDRLALLGQSVGWSQTRVAIPLSGARSSAYELELEPAEGIELTQAAFVPDPREEVEPQTVLADHGGRLLRMSPPSTCAATLFVGMRPHRGYPLAVLLTAALCAAVITFAWWHLRTLAETTDAATAILLAAPALFTALVAQPGRGSPAAAMLRVARGVLGLCGLLTYAAAAAIVMVPTHTLPIEHLPRRFWIIDLALSWVLVAVLLAPLAGPVYRAQRDGAPGGATGGGS